MFNYCAQRKQTTYTDYEDMSGRGDAKKKKGGGDTEIESSVLCLPNKTNCGEEATKRDTLKG